MPQLQHHVLRIGHSEETSIDAARRDGLMVMAHDHNAAVDAWLVENCRSLREHDHFELVVVDQFDRHVLFDISAKVSAVVRLSEIQDLVG